MTYYKDCKKNVFNQLNLIGVDLLGWEIPRGISRIEGNDGNKANNQINNSNLKFFISQGRSYWSWKAFKWICWFLESNNFFFLTLEEKQFLWPILSLRPLNDTAITKVTFYAALSIWAVNNKVIFFKFIILWCNI